MLLDKNNRLSARIFGHVLNFPLYDADCSSAARELLANGDVVGAIAEWKRLSDLGSGRARCVLSLLYLMGAPGIAVDLEEAKRIALSAITSERGYANYLLACIALREESAATGVKYLVESTRAGFFPAMTMFASLLAASKSGEQRQKAGKMLRQAAAAGHVPARLRLIGLRLSGRLGLAQRGIGLLLFLPIWLQFLVGIRFSVFSKRYFQCFWNATRPLFNEQGISLLQQRLADPRRRYVPGVLAATHVAAACISTGTLIFARVTVERLPFADSYVKLFGWVMVAAWPYTLSYLAALGMDADSRIALLVQTVFMTLVTALTVDVYTGQLLGPLPGWVIGLLSVAQAFTLLIARGLGVTAAQHLALRAQSVPPYRKPVLIAHCLAAAVVVGSVWTRSDVWSLSHLMTHGAEAIASTILAILPPMAAGIFSWRLVTMNRWRPWAYIGIVGVAAVLAVGCFSGALNGSLALLTEWGITVALSLSLCVAAEWALDGDPW